MDTISASDAAPARGRGRAPSTSRDDLGRIGMTLFMERGFTEVTVDDIAAAAGIGRRTFFRYFATKNDVAWGDFEALLDDFRVTLHRSAADVPLIDAIRLAVQQFNAVPVEATTQHRRRMRILLTTPDLVAHSTLRYAEWREVIAEFVAERLATTPRAALPQAVAWACLGISLSAYEQWIEAGESGHRQVALADLIDQSFEGLGDVFSGLTRERRP